MRKPIEAESTLTDRYQTTVPDPVRRALRLGKRDRIRYAIRSNGEVVLSRVEPAESHDPVLGHFLEFLAGDLDRHPERLQALDEELVARARSLVHGVDVDLNAVLPPEAE